MTPSDFIAAIALLLSAVTAYHQFFRSRRTVKATVRPLSALPFVDGKHELAVDIAFANLGNEPAAISEATLRLTPKQRSTTVLRWYRAFGDGPLNLQPRSVHAETVRFPVPERVIEEFAALPNKLVGVDTTLRLVAIDSRAQIHEAEVSVGEFNVGSSKDHYAVVGGRDHTITLVP